MKKVEIICDECKVRVGDGYCAFCKKDLCTKCSKSFLKIGNVSTIVCDGCKNIERSDITTDYGMGEVLIGFDEVEKFRDKVIEYLRAKRVLRKLDG